MSLRRRTANGCMLVLTGAATAVVLLPLGLILWQVAREGAAGLSLSFFTHLPAPPGATGGGMGNAIVGTLEMLGIALVFGLPAGLAGGIYLAEYGNERLTHGVRFTADVLSGIPTIVTGLFVYVLLVVPMHRFSGLAGGLALAMILLPLMLRAAEEVLRTVPRSYREAAIALGASRGRMLRDVVLRTARPGLIGAGLLGLSRVAGETAPLLFTALNNTQWVLRPDQPTASLTVQVYDYALAPFAAWHRQAWAGALTLIAVVLLLHLGARAGGRLSQAA